jgi:hypothetical protein
MNMKKYSYLKFFGYPKTLETLKNQRIVPLVHIGIKPTNTEHLAFA